MNFEQLIEDLKKGTGMKRAEAAKHLGKINDMRAVKPLVEALQDTNMGVRNNVAFALGELGAREAIPHLIKVLLGDPEEWVRKSAAKALGMLGSREAVSHLAKALKDQSQMVRKSAARSLGQIGGIQAVQALRTVSSLDSLVFRMAKEALEKLKTDTFKE
ncbi:MAG: HEAT repeat domain-containing protein [Nitrospirota bacterium]